MFFYGIKKCRSHQFNNYLFNYDWIILKYSVKYNPGPSYPPLVAPKCIGGRGHRHGQGIPWPSLGALGTCIPAAYKVGPPQQASIMYFTQSNAYFEKYIYIFCPEFDWSYSKNFCEYGSINLTSLFLGLNQLKQRVSITFEISGTILEI